MMNQKFKRLNLWFERLFIRLCVYTFMRLCVYTFIRWMRNKQISE